MKSIIIGIVSLLTISLACNKPDNVENNIYCCGAPPLVVLVNKFKEDNKSCSCLAGIREATYNSQSLLELYYYDPICNGVQRVYDRNGELEFTSADAAYNDYMEKKTDTQIRWTCKDGDQ